MIPTFLNHDDDLARQNEKLRKINEVLMRRVEQDTDDEGAGYVHFQRAVLLEDQVRRRTTELEATLDLLNQSNAQLADATQEAEASRRTLFEAIETIQEGFALFDTSERLTLFNSRFARFMPDVRVRLRPGLPFTEYVTFASRSEHLRLAPSETPESWARKRLRRHRENHVVFTVAWDTDKWMQVSEHRTANGQTVVIQTDVSDLMQSEKQARLKLHDHHSRQIAATLEHIDQGVLVFSRDAELIAWNDLVSDLLGLPARSLRLGTDVHEILRAMPKSLKSHLPREEFVRWLSHPAPRHPMDFEMSAAGGAFLKIGMRTMPDGGFVVSVNDVTVERDAAHVLQRDKEELEHRVLERTLELEDALSVAERANASRNRFVAAASHDLLQPLSAARLFVTSLAEEADALSKDTLTKTQTALDSVESMIQSLLTISKLETGPEHPTPQPFDLDRLLMQLDAEFRPSSRAKALNLRIRPTRATILTDPGYYRRIVQNLIGNAIRYTERGGVLVGARVRGNWLRLDVVDTGPGIPEESQGEIFGEFKRLGTRASATEGLGLGLAIVDRSAALLGHPLTLESRVGFGSRFSIAAPLAH